MTPNLRTAAIALILLATLSGCAAPVLVAGGAAAAETTSADRRTSAAVQEDNAIELKSQEAIYTNNQLKGQVHVNVTSFNGIVLLTGETPTEQMRDAVISLVQHVPRVRQIHNEIVIAPPSSIADRSQDLWLATKVKARLLGNKEVEGLTIKVITERGVVYLMGIVTPAEGDAATKLARQVEGIREIVKIFEYK